MISWPSVEPSASIITMMSPVQAANPAARASPLPLPVWETIFTFGRRRLATAIVSSTELPSTSTISSIHWGSVANTWGRFSASFMAGTTTLTVGEMAR
jgi:hypothetical protein